MNRLIWLALSLVIAVPLAASDTVSSLRQQELGNILVQDCGSCHGLSMRGGLGPALLPETLAGKSAATISAVIMNGRPGSAMPPWRALLSPAEAQWMAEILLSGELP
jgi:cytochrome c55X